MKCLKCVFFIPHSPQHGLRCFNQNKFFSCLTAKVFWANVHFLLICDVLFLLSRPVGDRMARIANHVIQQKWYTLNTAEGTLSNSFFLPPFSSYYPLLPAFRQSAKSTNQNPSSSDIDEETTEVNFNFIDAFENGHALLTVRPDLLILPSDLKPFIKARLITMHNNTQVT